MRYAKGQSEERLANKKAIIRANEIVKENIAKRNKRKKEEEAGSFLGSGGQVLGKSGGGLNENGLPNS